MPDYKRLCAGLEVSRTPAQPRATLVRNMWHDPDKFPNIRRMTRNYNLTSNLVSCRGSMKPTRKHRAGSRQAVRQCQRRARSKPGFDVAFKPSRCSLWHFVTQSERRIANSSYQCYCSSWVSWDVWSRRTAAPSCLWLSRSSPMSTIP